ncbi:MAG: hypothetical protein M1833_005251 [Piccolia ochrophora]|nr:MAG: hypothetical protein M1833_005251 [Piccolia ochrophora]
MSPMDNFRSYLRPQNNKIRTTAIANQQRQHESKLARSATSSCPLTHNKPGSLLTQRVSNAAVTVADGGPLSLDSTSGIMSTHSNPLEFVDGDAIQHLKAEMMVEFVWKEQRKRMWTSERPNEGVVLKESKLRYVCAPQSLERDRYGLFDAISAMNVKVAMTVTSKIIEVILSCASGDTILLADGLRLQIIQSFEELLVCHKHQFAAFVWEAQALVVWDDDPNNIISRATNVEAQLLAVYWDSTITSKEDNPGQQGLNPILCQSQDADGIEDVEPICAKRPTLLLAPVMVSATITLLCVALGLGWRQLANEYKVDPKYVHIHAYELDIEATLMDEFVTQFFMGVVISGALQMLGPTSQVQSNSKCYSAQRPRQLRRDADFMPHVTIQCPVYREGLASVIEPTIHSIKAAISTYEMQGGSANIFINDDGMQLISDEHAQRRKDFYDEHGIGWVARPRHNSTHGNDEKTFIRRGKFKKASNMNFALMISNKVEEKLLDVVRSTSWSQHDENKAYRGCLGQVLLEEQGKAWADGNVRIGDYILLIDSDTRVPVDCLLDAVSEMEQSPEVGVLQYSSGVMQVAFNFFENGITFFTNLIYTAIQYSCANGDVVPFVGHNAILRWSALQQVVYTDDDGYEKFWSESHVSEDFDMALRLQCLGYTIRFGAYSGDGFKEGVSLTVYDELARWEKYAYGCNELLFHPIRSWITRGPFTPLFRKFITSNIRVTSKITIMSYIGTYYAIGAAWIMTFGNFFIVGFLSGTPYLSKYYLDSFKIWFSLICVFNALGNVSLAVYRYRIGESSFFRALLTNFKWLPLLSIFLGGISLHVSQALLCHMFSIDMTWGATAKEVDANTTFAKEWKRFSGRFRGTFLFCLVCIATMVVFGSVVPELWRVTDRNATLPLAVLVGSHFLLPIVLNPGLMRLRW